jgi:hypothetical protein
MHEVFGHESITDPWIENLRMVDMGSGEGIRPNSISVHRAQTIGNDARLTAQFELTIEPSPGEVIWIAAGGKKGASIGVTIPRDFLLAMPVLLDVQMSIDEASGEWSTDSLSAWLGTESPAAQRDPVWRRLCEIQQIEEFADLGSAGRRASQRKVLEKTLQTKRQSPIAAAIAASILIRSNQLEALHDWPRNLANWFKWLPDGPVLWAETLIRRGNRTLSIPPLIEDAVIARARTPEYTEAREYFCRLADGGAPTLTASMLFALGQLPFWHRLLDSHTLKFIERRRLEDACERVERSAAALVSGSMFARYSYEEQAYDPGEVLGHRKRARESLRAATAG